jgi:nucleotide sugar dehydrogenase
MHIDNSLIYYIFAKVDERGKALYTAEVTRRIAKGNLRVCVVGLGRIGLPTAALFAEAGVLVTGVDIDPHVVKATNAGKCRFSDEPGLCEIVKNTVSTGRLRATTNIMEAVRNADAIIVSVPTPVDEAKSPDYSSIIKACQEIGRSMRKGSLVVIESTVGPGIVENLVLNLLEKESGLLAGTDFGLASCPERSDPGRIVSNMREVPRVIGGTDSASGEAAAALYEKALGVKVFPVSSAKTANAVKLTENLFRDVNIALANEFAVLYSKLGIDTIEVIDTCASKYNFMPHYPGAGVGGPCLPSNPYYLIVEGLKVGNIPHLVRTAREINDQMPDKVVDLVSETLNEVGRSVKDSAIAVLGIAYKPDIKDMQLTPIRRVCSRLLEMGASIKIYDPYFKKENVFGLTSSCSLDEAVKGADCILIGTAHKAFKKLKLSALRRLMKKEAVLVDSRNVIHPVSATTAGFVYRAIGRPGRLYTTSNTIPSSSNGKRRG